MGKGQSAREGLQSYIDANLRFTISYPESWARFFSIAGAGPYSPYSVSWNVESPGLNNDVSLTVVSIPQHEIIPWVETETILSDLYPNLTLYNRQAVTLPAGQAEKMSGYTPHKTLWAWTLNRYGRHYILLFTSPPDYFAKQTRLFDKIISSFEPLGD